MFDKASLSALMASMMVAAAAALGADKAVGPHSSLKPGKTRDPSSTGGGRAYGRNKFGSTAAFRRHAVKIVNRRAHRIACRAS